MKSRFLLDTQAFLHATLDEKLLTAKTRKILLDTHNTLFLSMASIWEMQIKLSIGKLRLPLSLNDSIQESVKHLGLELLPIQLEHLYRLGSLPFHHRDPFDRLLAAQALHEKMRLISTDKIFDRYAIDRLS